MIIVLAAALADLCGPVPAEPADPASAASYVAVADHAAAAGDARIAAIAYRKALALEPHDPHARAALDTLCRADRAAHDETSLLAAIARFRAGQLDEARAALHAIVDDGGPSAAGAHLFLGLIALQDHDGGEAVAELELARRDPSYAALAEPLVRLAHRDGRLAARLLFAPEFDTNPQLVPDTPPAGALTGPPAADEDLLAVATLAARPVRGLVLRDTLEYRDQLHLDALDFVGENAEAGLELDHRRTHLAVLDAFDYDLLASEPYLVANAGRSELRQELGKVALVGSYGLRWRDYQPATVAAFTGWVHEADAGVIVHVTSALDLDVRARGTRELTRDAEFSNVAGGGSIAVRARLADGLRLAASGTGWYAAYDAAEPDGTVRRDLHGEAAADVELDLGNYMLATCGLGVIGNRSTVEDFRYWKLIARCGLALAIGGP